MEEWTAFMFGAVFRAYYVPVKCAAAKQACFLTLKVFFPVMATGTPDDFGPVCHDPADDNAGSLLDDEVVAIEECNDRVGRLFDADDVVRVDIHLLFVHAGQKYHVVT
jgi:hypothetical protein